MHGMNVCGCLSGKLACIFGHLVVRYIVFRPLEAEATVLFKTWGQAGCQHIWSIPAGNATVADLVFTRWECFICQRIWCSPVRNAGVPEVATVVKEFVVHALERLHPSANLSSNAARVSSWQGIGCSPPANAAHVSGFRVHQLETVETSRELHLSKNLVFTRWKRRTCQRIRCSPAGNAILVRKDHVHSWKATPVSGFVVHGLETLHLSATFVLTR